MSQSNWDKEQLAKFEAEQMRQQHGETLTVLDALRRSRKSRGGVGAPLQVPGHLRDAANGNPSIVVTDDDLKANSAKPIGGLDDE